jgi:hypothetical protein
LLETSVSSVSATGFTVNMARYDGTSTIIYWVALAKTQ